MKSIKANGKLLITGEYLILKGAKGLAIPTSYGQSLTFEKNENDSLLHWNSLDVNNQVWFSATFDLKNSNLVSSSNHEKARFILNVLVRAGELANHKEHFCGKIITKLDFNKEWGLGSSSTLIWSIASIFEIDPLALHFHTSNGSGYDIVCAGINYPITYKLEKHKQPIYQKVNWNPIFKDEIQFVYLNKKQNSEAEVNRFLESTTLDKDIFEINQLTDSIMTCEDLNEFENSITEHEKIVGNLLQKTPIKQKLFKDYPGAIKSLGAWGGDFILATRKNSSYFEQRGYNTVISFNNMIKK